MVLSMIFNEQEAYNFLSNTVMDFIKNRIFDKAFCKCEVYTNMVSTTCWLECDGVIDDKSIDYPDSQIPTDEAVYYLKDLAFKKIPVIAFGDYYSPYTLMANLR